LWFPVTLGFLLLLALPALLLLVLHLFDLANFANGWLQEKLGLSYRVPIPIWACFILVALPLLLLLLYFLKLKRQPLAVPSTYLWRKSIDDMQVNTLFQWMRRNVLLLLQLVTLLILMYALLAPQLFANTTTGRRYIIVIDNSASMSATDVAPSRLEQAREEALKEIDAYSDDDIGMVIEFNSRARVLQTFTADRNLLRRAVRSIEPSNRVTRIDEALLQADGRANPGRTTDDAASAPTNEDPTKARTYVRAEGQTTEVHLFSDGGFPDVSDFSLGNLQMNYHSIGNPGRATVNNVGFVSLTANRVEKKPEMMRVFGNVRTFGKPARARVQLDVLVNGKPLPGLREIDLNNGKELTYLEDNSGVFTFDLPNLLDQGTTILHARLVNHKDDFKADDEAFLVVGAMRQARVLVVGPGENLFLKAFFDEASGLRLATVNYIEPADLKSDTKYLLPAQQGNWDLVVFDRCAPASETEMPFANTFFIDAVPPPFNKSDYPTLKNPRIRGWDTKHPLMRGLTGLQEIDIAQAFQFDLRDRRVPLKTPRLLEIDRDNAVMFTLPRHSFTDTVMTFPLLVDDGKWNTFWPLKLSFLLFMRNLVVTMGNVRDDDKVQPGGVKLIYPDTPIEKMEIVDPQNKVWPLTKGQRQYFSFDRTEALGIYDVRWNNSSQRAFAVNLLDSSESDLVPRTEFKIGATKVEAGESRKQPHDIWKWVAVFALGMLLIEWFIYNRRILF